MLRDLVSPWCTAVAAPDGRRLQVRFQERHHAIIDPLLRQRATHVDAILPADIAILRRAARRASDITLQQRLRDTIDRAAQLGFDHCRQVVLLPGTERGDPVEPIVAAVPWLALFIPPGDDDAALMVALARGLAALTRWQAVDSASALATRAPEQWDRWELARTVPLAEWIYTVGVGLHVAQELFPELPPAVLLGVNPGAFARLRERERVLQRLLDADLDHAGRGLHLRWLTRDTPTGPRTVGDFVIPSQAGEYLAWRMLADRVGRTGIAGAARMAV